MIINYVIMKISICSKSLKEISCVVFVTSLLILYVVFILYTIRNSVLLVATSTFNSIRIMFISSQLWKTNLVVTINISYKAFHVLMKVNGSVVCCLPTESIDTA